MDKCILAADLGGTSCRFGYFECRRGRLKKLDTFWIDVSSASSFAVLLESLRQSEFYRNLGSCDVFVLAAAGPVSEGRYCSPPNINWDIDLWDAQKHLGIKRCIIINDFVAQACACVSPIAQNAELVIAGEADRTRPIAVIGAGTGLGKAYLVPDGNGGYLPGASEGGHVNFAPESEREFEFFKFACEKYGCEYLTVEHVVSGRGISVVHEFLAQESLLAHEVASKFDEATETVEWLARFFGRACRNFTLDVLARGGVFITGGIAAKNPVLVQHPEFARAFHASPTHTELFQQIPVRLIADQESGLWGGAYSLMMRR